MRGQTEIRVFLMLCNNVENATLSAQVPLCTNLHLINNLEDSSFISLSSILLSLGRSHSPN